MSAWIVILAVAAGSYALRVSMFVFLGGRDLPAWASTPMSLVAPAAIGALTASVVFVADGATHAVPVPEMVAIVFGFVAARRTGNVMHAFTVGLPAFWLASLIAAA